jgi:rhodanese-related sulfurtransferase
MQLVLTSTITFQEVLPAAVCAYIKEHPETILLDVRTQAEYNGTATPNFGTLKGAINIPVQELSQRLSELEQYKGKEILVFCSHSHRSPQAAYLLTQNGYTKVTNMSGGMSVLQDKTCKK